MLVTVGTGVKDGSAAGVDVAFGVSVAAGSVWVGGTGVSVGAGVDVAGTGVCVARTGVSVGIGADELVADSGAPQAATRNIMAVMMQTSLEYLGIPLDPLISS